MRESQFHRMKRPICSGGEAGTAICPATLTLRREVGGHRAKDLIKKLKKSIQTTNQTTGPITISHSASGELSKAHLKT